MPATMRMSSLTPMERRLRSPSTSCGQTVKAVTDAFPGTLITIIVMDKEDSDRFNYVSNCDRKDMTSPHGRGSSPHEEGNTMIRTGYSFRVAAGRLEEVLDSIVEIGWKDAPDSRPGAPPTHSLSGPRSAPRGTYRPIYGVELAVSPEPAAPKPVYDYWSFYANGSLRELNELVTQATMSPGREPALRYEEALASGLMKVTGPAVLPHLLPSPRDDLSAGLSPASPRAGARALLKAGHRPVHGQRFLPEGRR